MKRSAKYLQLRNSIEILGIIEYPIVMPKADGPKFDLVHGHWRIEAAKDLGHTHVTCLIALDDEGYTHNKYLSRIATIQEAKMVLTCVERGVSSKTIAEIFNIDVASLQSRLRLADSLCPEAAELLKDKHVPQNTFRALSKMVPLRQIEAAETMIDFNNYTASCARCLLASTPQSQLKDTTKPKRHRGVSEETLERMERESANLTNRFKLIEQGYGSDHLELMLARGFLSNLLANSRISRYLAQHHSDILREFRKLVDLEQHAA